MTTEPVPEPAGEMTVPTPSTGVGAVEAKTKFGALGAYLGAFALLTVLSSTTTDMVADLPDWLETPVYSVLAAATAFLTAYLKNHKPGQLSLSALRAARVRR